jgi:hypothetical protein
LDQPELTNEICYLNYETLITLQKSNRNKL